MSFDGFQMCRCGKAVRVRLAVVLILAAFSSSRVGAADSGWQDQALSELCHKYLGSSPDPGAGFSRSEWLTRLAASMGRLLAAKGTGGLPAGDLALLAYLYSLEQTGLPAPQAVRDGPTDSYAEETSGQEASPASPQEAPETRDQDITKGQEGLIQAIERFAEMPLSERLVMTGDVTAGVQAAAVPGAPNLTSVFGRTRVNFVLRALPSAAGRWDEGYFFVQMMATGGPPDGSGLGGPVPFSAFNDVATDRSRFNEGFRGNLFLNKAYYEQGLGLKGGRLVARAGVVDLSDYFDTNLFANNEVRQFMNSALVNGAGYKTGITAPAIVAEYAQPVDGDWLRGIALRGASAFLRTDRAFNSPLWSGEVELQTLWKGREGNWRFGGNIGNVAGAGGIRGFHMSMDHWVSSHVGIFARYTIANSGPGSVLFGAARQAYSAGLQWRLVDEQDKVSAWAVGFSQTFGIETEERLASERILETYYRWQLSRNFSLTPNLQMVFGSGGRASNGTQGLVGMRAHFGF